MEEYFLKGYGEKAVPAKQDKANTQKLQQIFNAYKDGASGRIEVEGMEKFFNDIGIDASSPLSLVLSKYMGAQTMGFYTFDEF